MYIKLNEKYLLRGWKGAGCGLVNRTTNNVRFYKPGIYNLLRLADGVTQIAQEDLSAEEHEQLSKLVEQEILAISDDLSPIDPTQRYHQYGNRFVRSVLWSVTGKCNFNCKHCYMDAPNGLLGEITHDEAMSFVEQIAECGILEVALTGGETLVRKDIKEIIQKIHEKGIFLSQIYTNGWLVTEDILDFLDSLGIKPEFNFSFDGLNWHDWMRGVSGAEERVLNAIKLCQNRGFPTGVEISLHKKSFATLRATINLMGELNTHVRVGSIMNTELWQKNNNGYGYSDEEYIEDMLRYIPMFFEDGMPVNLFIGGIVRLHKGSTQFRIPAEKYDGTESCLDRHMCGAARANAYIAADGRLVPCMPMTSWPGYTMFPKIQDVGLKQGLTDGLFMNFVNGKIRELFDRNEKCNSCEHKYRCGGGCRAYALKETNDLYASDPSQCLYWKNGYVKRIREVTEAAIEKYCSTDEAALGSTAYED